MNTMRKNTAVCLAALAGLAAGAAGQTFHHVDGTVGDDVPYDVIATKDGGYATAGYVETVNPFNGELDRDFYVVKHRADGAVSWSTRFGSSARDEAYSIEQTADGGYIVAGQTAGAGPELQLALLRLDPGGSPIWDFAYRADAFGELVNPMEPDYFPQTSVIESFNGEIFAVSNVRTEAGNQLGVLLHVDPAGGLISNQAYFDSVNPELSFLAFTDLHELAPFDEDGDGVVDNADLAITGYTTRVVDPGGNGSIFLGPQNMLALRVKRSGGVIWAGEYFTGSDNAPANEEGYGIDVARNADGEALVVGANQDFGEGTTFSTHHFWIDAASGALVRNHLTFGLVPSFAATRFTGEALRTVTGGADVGLIPSPTGTSAAVAVNPTAGGVALIDWLATYTDLQTDYFDRFQGVALPREGCGYAFTTPERPRGGFGGLDNYLVKTNDLGETACLFSFVEPEQDTPPVESIPRRFDTFQDEASEPWGFQREIGQQDFSVCYDDDCSTGCPIDFNADGVLNNTDINAFVALFLAMNPAADLNNDGFWNNADINLFVALFLNGC